MNSELASQPEGVAGGQTTRLRWLGHATFLITSPSGVQLLLDPFNVELGYPVPELPPIDLVAVSHEHADHNNVGLAPGVPKVVRGISDSGWHPGTVSVGDVTLSMIGGWKSKVYGYFTLATWGIGSTRTSWRSAAGTKCC